MSHQSELIAEDIHAYLKQHEDKQLLRLLTCGSVDDGKSTLIGRLLHDSKMIYEDQLEALEKDSKTSGTTGEDIDLALLVDGLQAEREQGITIDVAYRYFSTTRRKFIIADTPGHEQYTRNMVTGASNCELAIILIDARQGVQVQTCRHTYLVSLLGIKHLVVAINKMDLVDYSEETFNQIREDYLKFTDGLNVPEVHFVPLSALKGDNVVTPSEAMSWYSGQPLMELLESVDTREDTSHQPLRFPVQYVNRPHLNFRGYCGTLASGEVKPGDSITALPSGKTSRVQSIVTYEGELERAYAPMAVTLTLEDEIDISRGDLLVRTGEEPRILERFEAELVWMAEEPLVPGKTYLLKLGPNQVNAQVTALHYKTQVNTLERQPTASLELNEIARVEIQLEKPLAADAYAELPNTGSFILVDRFNQATAAAGMVQTAGQDAASRVANQQPVTAEERAARLGQKAVKIELSGDDARLRREVLQQLERLLFDRGRLPLLLTDEELSQELARQQPALEQLLLSKGLLLLTASASDQPGLQAQISGLETPLKLEADNAAQAIFNQLRDSGAI
ncbi:bifunctional enzyme CysN/CysC [Marinospirillum celere]|uniref:Sulfate adenylyltransferase subunit 1 n=1 Tax=Marinospirillum celere TaxID=1122252 RepID=A0A1I1G3R3_9GAMM|nr:sulfate adenylyltransferase subunit CysN [Marinospirillum celere]SFC06185.1 bifunctional enzyme CysN/CysC [Marinospirillum celere]